MINSELGDRGGLYMWAGGIRILKCCNVVMRYILSLDDLCFVVLVKREFSNFVMFWDFKLKGYPAFETFNEMFTFQILFEFNYLS